MFAVVLFGSRRYILAYDSLWGGGGGGAKVEQKILQQPITLYSSFIMFHALKLFKLQGTEFKIKKCGKESTH